MAGNCSSDRRRLVAAVIINFAIFVMEAIATCLSYSRNGWSLLRFYTEDSNMLAGIISLVFSVVAIRTLRLGHASASAKVPDDANGTDAAKGRGDDGGDGGDGGDGDKTGPSLPLWMRNLRLMATSCLALTFFVVLLVLAPMATTIYGPAGYLMMFTGGSMFFQHLICPLLSFVSLIFLELQPRIPRHEVIFSLIPTVLYAVVIVILNIARVVEGPYPFLLVYQQPVWQSVLWVLGIVGGAYLLALMFWKLSDAVAARKALA